MKLFYTQVAFYEVPCEFCHGTCQLPGRNYVTQGWVAPFCWHCRDGKRMVRIEFDQDDELLSEVLVPLGEA